MQNLFDGSFFDEDYFKRGKETGKSFYQDYKWMPRRSIREALAICDYLNLDDKSYVLDYGCAKGYLVKAFRRLDILCDGCDISEYALSFAPDGCWDCSNSDSFSFFSSFGYTHIVCKDVLEHLTKDQLKLLLRKLPLLAKKFLVIVPLGDNGVYRIPEYHLDTSHIIAEDEYWWSDIFYFTDWNIVKSDDRIFGIKDNWYLANPEGNKVFYLEYKWQ